MRYAEIISETILDEEVTTKPLNLFHGTDSDTFASFNPGQATKGDAHYNPLGQGMYATDSIRFALRFGRNVHRVTIPAGARYKRITHRQWSQSVGRNIITRALRVAFEQNGMDYSAYASGKATQVERDWEEYSAQDLATAYDRYCLGKRRPRRTTRPSREELDMMLDALITKAPQVPIPGCREDVQTLWGKIDQLLAANAPFAALRDIGLVVGTVFGFKVGRSVHKALPAISDEVFSEYDFVIFTDTLDHGTGKGGRSALEVVIFNPELQKTEALSMDDHIKAHMAA
jgi:hypothetical protein